MIVTEQDINIRLDVYLNENLNDLSRTFIQNQIEEGNILINDKKIKPNYKLRLNDLIILNIQQKKEIILIPQKINLNIIYEDDDIIIIDKPKNLVVHPSCGHFDNTLVNGLLFHCGNNLSYLDDTNQRPGIVHRLDKDTSGVLVATKNNYAHDNLKDQFKSQTVLRQYKSILFGNLKNDEGIIDKPLSRSEKDRKKYTAKNPNGKDAITHYKVLTNFKGFTYVSLILKTGRTHQIRVHTASINHPVLGDKIYGSKKQPFGLDTQVLHADTLGFMHPTKKTYMEFSSRLPEYFEKLLINL